MPSILQFRALGEMLQRANFAVRSGLTFGGKRDLYAALGYTPTLGIGDYRSRYKRGDIATRVVDAYPKATWRGGAELVEDEDPEVLTPFEEAWLALDQEHQIWSTLGRLDILAGLGRYAGLLIGAADNQELEQPVGKVSALLYLWPYGEDELIIDAYVKDTKDPRYGLPEFYRLTRTGDSISVNKRVHHSRILHVADGVIDDKVYGTPRLEKVWNRLDDLDKIVGAGSEAFWRRADQGLYFNIDPDAKVADSAIPAMKDSAEEFVHGMKRVLALQGAKVTALGSDVADFSSQVASVISLISGATGIPQRLLLGSERGELASSQDKENWDRRVDDRRVDFAEPVIVRPLVQRLTEMGLLPEVEGYDIRWPEIEDQTEMDRASIAEKLAKLNDLAKGWVILPEEIRDRILRLDPLTDEQIAELDEEKEARTPDMTPNPDDPNAEPNAPPANDDDLEEPKAARARRVASARRPKAQVLCLARRTGMYRGSPESSQMSRAARNAQYRRD